MGILSVFFKILVKKPDRPRVDGPYRRNLRVATPRVEIQSVALPAFPEAGVLQGKCYVIDGDTIVIKRTKIRLAGIDAPELGKPWGHKSKWAMVGICKGQIVTARLNGERSHDRLVGTFICLTGAISAQS